MQWGRSAAPPVGYLSKLLSRECPGAGPLGRCGVGCVCVGWVFLGGCREAGRVQFAEPCQRRINVRIRW